MGDNLQYGWLNMSILIPVKMVLNIEFTRSLTSNGNISPSEKWGGGETKCKHWDTMQWIRYFRSKDNILEFYIGSLIVWKLLLHITNFYSRPSEIIHVNKIPVAKSPFQVEDKVRHMRIQRHIKDLVFVIYCKVENQTTLFKPLL